MGAVEQLPKMQYRNLGRSGLKVSVISLGGWVTYGGSVGDGNVLGTKMTSVSMTDNAL